MAAAYRDAIRTVEDVSQRQLVQSLKGENVDVFGFFEAGDDVSVCLLVVRGGRRPGPAGVLLREVGGGRVRPLPRSVPAAVLRRQPVSARGGAPPRADREPQAPGGIPDFRAAAPGSACASPRRGPAARAGGTGERERAAAPPGAVPPGRRTRAARARAAGAGPGPAVPPRRIEAFDISHLQGTDSVASLVVFEDGRPKKSDYRLFGIASQSLLAPDDFRSMAEAVERRYRRLRDESRPMPDLVVVDGGRGQLQAALTALDRVGIVAAGRRPRQARGGDLGAGPARADPALAQGPGLAARPAPARRGAPLRRSRVTAAGARAGCARRA